MSWLCVNLRIQDGRTCVISLQHQDGKSQLITRLTFHDNSNISHVLLSSDILSYLGHLGLQSTTGRAFPGTARLRKRLSTEISSFWNTLDAQQQITACTVLYLYETSAGLRGWVRQEEDEFRQYNQQLKTLDELLGGQPDSSIPEQQVQVLSQFDISFGNGLDSLRGSCVKCTTHLLPHRQLVFKGITFADYLAFPEDVFRCRRDGLYREVHLLCNSIAPHPNIMRRPTNFVSPTGTARQGVREVSGVIYEEYLRGTMASTMEENLALGTRISLARKAKWCFQLADALLHVHKCGAWHQDLKPPNILLDDDDNIVIIDWEQGIGGANTFISAPEVGGSYDLQVVPTSNSQKPSLVYLPYTGPARVNNIVGEPHWDVFAEWWLICEHAIEAAEVFSFGSTAFLLLEQVHRGGTGHSEDYSGAKRKWSSASSDVPGD